MQSRTYEQDGRTVYVTEVVADSVQFLESKGSQPKAKPEPKQETPYDHMPDGDPFKNDGEPIDINGDDLPF